MSEFDSGVQKYPHIGARRVGQSDLLSLPRPAIGQHTNRNEHNLSERSGIVWTRRLSQQETTDSALSLYAPRAAPAAIPSGEPGCGRLMRRGSQYAAGRGVDWQ